MNLKECYTAAGADYEDVVRRFMREDRVDRFLTMFLRDQSYGLLCGAMEAENYEEAFRAVHTMKGICMNLSLCALLNSCVELTENLRGGAADENTPRLFEQVKQEYVRTVGAVESHLAETGKF